MVTKQHHKPNARSVEYAILYINLITFLFSCNSVYMWHKLRMFLGVLRVKRGSFIHLVNRLVTTDNETLTSSLLSLIWEIRWVCFSISNSEHQHVNWLFHGFCSCFAPDWNLLHENDVTPCSSNAQPSPNIHLLSWCAHLNTFTQERMCYKTVGLPWDILLLCQCLICIRKNSIAWTWTYFQSHSLCSHVRTLQWRDCSETNGRKAASQPILLSE